MARETKVGLLVGLGMILLIGIIVSDYLSVAKSQDPARMTDFAPKAQRSVAPAAPEDAAAGDAVMVRAGAGNGGAALRLPGEARVADTLAPALPAAPGVLGTAPTPAGLTPAPAASPAPRGAEPAGPPLPEAIASVPAARPGEAAASAVNLVPSTSDELAALHTLSSLSSVGPRPTATAPPPAPLPASGVAPPPVSMSVVPAPVAAAPAPGLIASTPAAPPPAAAREAASPTASAALAPTSTSAPAASAGAATHVVKKGDTLIQLGRTYYKDDRSWKLIEEANAAKLAATKGQLREGMSLVIPSKPGAAIGAAEPAAIKPAARPTPSDPLLREHPDLFESAATPDAKRTAGASAAPAPTAGSGATVEVKANDSLMTLALRHLGSSQRWRDLLNANKDVLKKPEDLKQGMRLKLPASAPTPAGSAAGKPAASTAAAAAPILLASPALATEARAEAAAGPTAPVAAASAAASKPQTYTVQPGDTLSSIAAKTLGGSGRWKALLDANRGRLDDPESLRAGQVLMLPEATGR